MTLHYLNSTPVIINIMSLPRGIFGKELFKTHIVPFLNIDLSMMICFSEERCQPCVLCTLFILFDTCETSKYMT